MDLPGLNYFIEYEYIGSRVAQRNYAAVVPNVLYEPVYDNFGRITTSRTYQNTTDITRFDYTFDANSNNIILPTIFLRCMRRRPRFRYRAGVYRNRTLRSFSVRGFLP